MLRLTNISNQYKRRTLRALYAQTQAYPYATSLASSFVRTGGLLTASATSSTAKAAIYPGMVAFRKYYATDGGEVVTTNSDAPNSTTDQARAMGLFANFVGGDLDELFGAVECGVWRGAGGVFEVLSPAFDDAKDIAGNTTALATAYTSDTGAGATDVYLGANADSRLAQDPNSIGPQGYTFGNSTTTDTAAHVKANVANRAVCRLLQRLSATAIIIELLV